MMTETRKSIDECSGEEWNAASKGHWDFLRTSKVYEEDPVYSTREDKIIADRWVEDEEDIFSGSLFDEADEDQGDTESVYLMLKEEDAFEQIVQVLGPWDAISFCHGTVLSILLDKESHTSSREIEKAKTYLSRMARLISETEGVNW
jgi:hypothetical protein